MKKLISMMAIIFAVTFTSLSAQSAEKLSPAELIKLRTEWDNRLREGAEKIAANPPQFELHYFEEPLPQELTDSDYENETMSFKIIIPYLKQIAGFENIELANSLLDKLHKIPESKNWGDKINGFPWSYAEDIGNDNWMLKALSGHVDKYNFIISIVDENKNILVQKPISYMVCYAKQYSGFIMVSDHSGYSSTNSAPEAYENDTIYFLISIKNVNIDKLTVQVENRGKQNLAILPAEEGAVRYELIKKDNDKVFRYFKIVGNVNYNFYNEYVFSADKNGMTAIDLSSAYKLNESLINQLDVKKNEFNYRVLSPGSSLSKQEEFKKEYDTYIQNPKLAKEKYIWEEKCREGRELLLKQYPDAENIFFKQAAKKKGILNYDVNISKLDLYNIFGLVGLIQENLNKEEYLDYKDKVFCFELDNKWLDASDCLKYADFNIALKLKAARYIEYNFKDCRNLVEVQIDCSDKKLDRYTFNFRNCSNLESIWIDGDSYIDFDLYGCKNLNFVRLPKRLKGTNEKKYPELKKKKVFDYY